MIPTSQANTVAALHQGKHDQNRPCRCREGRFPVTDLDRLRAGQLEGYK
jgi:hypothetical protein